MNAFVIAKKNLEFLETPVFHVGESNDEEAIAVFTNRELAAGYIEEADWSDECEVGELLPIQLVRWLAVACEEGTKMIVVNPARDEQLAGAQQKVVYLDEPFSAFADLLQDAIIKQSNLESVSKG